jgi:hypothetical protein
MALARLQRHQTHPTQTVFVLAAEKNGSSRWTRIRVKTYIQQLTTQQMARFAFSSIWCFSTKYGRLRITNREFMGVHEMCLRILDFMRDHGCNVTSSGLRRGLNAYRYPERYGEAFQELLSLKALKVGKEPASRRQWVTLLRIPREFEATKPKPKRRHKPRSRGQTYWFKRLMAEQELED